MSHAALLQSAIDAHQLGDITRAVELYEKILKITPNDADALHLLGMLRHSQKRSEEGVQLITRALQQDANNPPAWFNLGLIYFDHRKFREAAAAFMEAAKRGPDQPEFWLALGRAYTQGKEFAAALATFTSLTQIAPQNPQSWLELAQAHEHAHAYENARNVAEKALELALAQRDTPARRLAFAIITNADRMLNMPERQWEWALKHTQIAPEDAESWVQLARCALAHSRNAEADDYLAKAQGLDATRFDIRWLRTFNLPLPIYESHAQIVDQIALYTKSVIELHAYAKTLTDAQLGDVNILFQQAHALFLAYTGEDVTEAQRVTGEFFAYIMQRLYKLPALTPPKRDKIHIAFVSETFYYHSNMKLRRSWLKRLDRSKFHITCYHVGKTTDEYTLEIKAMVDELHHYPEDFDGVLARLLADKPDIIQYTNIGLKHLTIRLAALRLAPMQCTTWGHPITSGLPTMDYYISSALMEPADAQTHYIEKLVNLPGLSVVPQPVFNVADRTYKNLSRSDFGLSDADMVYLCIQSLQKYLPQFDDVHARIAQRVANAKFCFIMHAENAAIADVFKARMRAPFVALGLDPAKHLVFLPFQDQNGYRALNMLADVTLDSIGWSGANTTFEALELGGLVMTHPGPFMRARHTSGALELMEMQELIAPTIDDYVDLAAELGNDTALRADMRAKLKEKLALLHADPGVGDALNAFYLSAKK